MRGYPIIFGQGVDPDAYQYFLRAGIASGTQTPSSYDNAASFNGTNQFLSIPSNSTLTVTGTSFTYAFWANAVDTTTIQLIFNKSNATGIEYRIMLLSGLLRFQILPDGVTWETRKEINIGAGAVNTWNFYVCRYDSSGGGTMGISLNGGAFTSLGSVGAITQTLSSTLEIANSFQGVTNRLYTGQLSSIGFWKKALSPSEVTALWNNGAGRTYASLDTGLRNNLVSWWALNQNSVTADSHGTNTLTNNGSVTAPNIGPIVTTTQNSRQLINNFVKGIKSLGLWNSMVCWPMRASQNAGSGTTAFSLGGLGQFNGMLSSSGALPTWTADGVENTAANSINFGNSFASTRAFVHVFAKTDTADTSGSSLASYSTNPERGYEILYNGANAPEIRFYAGDFQNNARTPSINCNDGNQHFVSGITDGSSAQWFVDGSAGSFSALTHTPLTPSVGSLIAGGRSNGTVSVACRSAFVAVFTAYTAQMSQVYTRYKATLGLGLGLP